MSRWLRQRGGDRNELTGELWAFGGRGKPSWLAKLAEIDRRRMWLAKVSNKFSIQVGHTDAGCPSELQEAKAK